MFPIYAFTIGDFTWVDFFVDLEEEEEMEFFKLQLGAFKFYYPMSTIFNYFKQRGLT